MKLSIQQSFLACVSFVVLSCTFLSAQSNLEIDGVGWLQSRQLESRIAFLHGLDPDAPTEIDAVFLEDSAFLILEEVRGLGYLKPELKAELETTKGKDTVTWDSEYSVQVDAEYAAESVVFKVLPGVRYYYDSVEVSGVDVIEESRVQRFFIPGGYFFGNRAAVFTEGSLDRRVGRLLESLDALGYRSAREVDRAVEQDAETGKVNARITIEQGARYEVGRVEVTVETEGEASVVKEESALSGRLYTEEWEQTLRIELRNEAYKLGYPDARVRVANKEVNKQGDAAVVNLNLVVVRGERVRLGEVRYEGDSKMRASVLNRKVNLEQSEWLDPLQVNAGQRALMGLGVFRDVDLNYEPESGPERAVIYSMEPGMRQSLDLLLGWGSYEQARVGFKWEHINPWGAAHRYEVEAKKSLKASRLQTTYSIPYIFNLPLTAYARGEYAYREEISYESESTGVAVGTSWRLGKTGIRMATEYGYAQESSDRNRTFDFNSLDQATVASLTFRASLDRRDDFLQPSSGYSLFSSYKWASELLGGSVDYIQIELGGSYHRPILESVLVHLGLRGGLITSSGRAEDNIPFNTRFFTGGENSVRGYREGQASPLDSIGEAIGAESYVLLNFELEQRLSKSFSVVEFIDMVYSARSGFFDASTEFLYSVGLGIRYQSVVGPIRLEYGYNPKPRAEDTQGRLHLSVGFPF
jgi:outer membrane protein assembly factor BamA